MCLVSMVTCHWPQPLSGLRTHQLIHTINKLSVGSLGNGRGNLWIQKFISLPILVGICTCVFVRHNFFPQINYPWIWVWVWIIHRLPMNIYDDICAYHVVGSTEYNLWHCLWLASVHLSTAIDPHTCINSRLIKNG